MADVYANAGIEAAKIAGDSVELTEAAENLAALTRGFALANGDTAYADSVEVVDVPAARRRSVRTRAVITTDPLAGPKELGHVVRNEPGGPVIGYAKPLRYMFKALKAAKEESGD